MIRFGDAYITESEIAAIFPSDTDDKKVWVALKGGRMIRCELEMIEAEHVMVDAGLVLLGEVDPKSMVVILLETLFDDGFRYLARDKNGEVYAFENEPTRGEICWDVEDGRTMQVMEHAFSTAVRWENPEPGIIPLMLEDAWKNPARFV